MRGAGISILLSILLTGCAGNEGFQSAQEEYYKALQMPIATIECNGNIPTVTINRQHIPPPVIQAPWYAQPVTALVKGATIVGSLFAGAEIAEVLVGAGTTYQVGNDLIQSYGSGTASTTMIEHPVEILTPE